MEAIHDDILCYNVQLKPCYINEVIFNKPLPKSLKGINLTGYNYLIVIQ